MTKESKLKKQHCVKSVRIRSFCGQYFPEFELNTERYEVPLRFSPNAGKYGSKNSEYGHFPRSARHNTTCENILEFPVKCQIVSNKTKCSTKPS